MVAGNGKNTPTPPRRPPLHPNVKLLGWASFFNDVASEMAAPLLPAFLAALGGGKQALGWIEGVADALASLLKLFSGAWSDRLQNRKGLVALGYAIPALLRPLLSLATSPWQVMGIRAGDRFGKGIRTSARDALIADSTPAPYRGFAFGFHRAMDHLGAALGPLLAFALLYFFPDSLRTLFLLTLFPGVAVAALVCFGLRDQRQDVVAATPPPQRAPLGRRFWKYLLAVGVFSLGSSTDLFLLARLGDLGVPAWGLPLLWCLFHLLKSAGNWISGHWTDRIPPQRLLLAGWLLYGFIYFCMGQVESIGIAVGLFMLYAAYYALTEPAEKALVVRLTPAAVRGQAFGWFHFVTGIAVLPASVLFGWLYDRFGASIAFQSGAALALVAVLLLLLTFRSTAFQRDYQF